MTAFRKVIPYISMLLIICLAAPLEARGRGGGGRGGGGRGGGGRGGGMHRGGGGRGGGMQRGRGGRGGGMQRGRGHNRTPSMSRSGKRHGSGSQRRRGRPGEGRPGGGDRPGGGRPGRPGGGRPNRPGHHPGRGPGRGHRHTHHHYYGGWNGHRYWWGGVAFGFFTGFIVGQAVSNRNYDYGSGGNVYIDETNIVVEGDTILLSEWREEAEELATDLPSVDAEATEWQPLGVYALVPEGSSASTINMYLQLSVNENGVISGAYWNSFTDYTQAVQGQIERESGRVAWTMTESQTPVMEAGAKNLTEENATMLVYFEDGSVQTWKMIRQEAPPEEMVN